MPTFAFYIGEGTWRDRLIRWATRDMESHIEYVVGDLSETNYCISASKRDGNRVRGKTITWKPDHWVFFTVPGDDARVHDRLLAEMGKPYDALGAVLTVTPFRRHIEGKWFCSELMAHALELPTPHWYTPGRLRALFMKSATNIGSA